jgi:hypothetical protein
MTTLRELALAATPKNGYTLSEVEALQAMQRALSPERVLAMLDVIDEVKILQRYDNMESRTKLRAALARLDDMERA